MRKPIHMVRILKKDSTCWYRDKKPSTSCGRFFRGERNLYKHSLPTFYQEFEHKSDANDAFKGSLQFDYPNVLRPFWFLRRKKSYYLCYDGEVLTSEAWLKTIDRGGQKTQLPELVRKAIQSLLVVLRVLHHKHDLHVTLSNEIFFKENEPQFVVNGRGKKALEEDYRILRAFVKDVHKQYHVTRLRDQSFIDTLSYLCKQRKDKLISHDMFLDQTRSLENHVCFLTILDEVKTLVVADILVGDPNKTYKTDVRYRDAIGKITYSQTNKGEKREAHSWKSDLRSFQHIKYQQFQKEMKVGDSYQPKYTDTASGFLRYCRNIITHSVNWKDWHQVEDTLLIFESIWPGFTNSLIEKLREEGLQI